MGGKVYRNEEENPFIYAFKYGYDSPLPLDQVVTKESLLLLPYTVYTETQKSYETANPAGNHSAYKVVSVLKACVSVPFVPILLVMNLVQSVVFLIFRCYLTCCEDGPFADLQMSCGHFAKALLRATLIGEVALWALDHYAKDAPASPIILSPLNSGGEIAHQ